LASEVVMPKMGYDMEEGKVVQWIKQEGDPVESGEVIAEIETGKVNIEIEAFDSGVLRLIVAREGETVPVGGTIAWITDPDEELPGAPGDGKASPVAAAPLAEEAQEPAAPAPEPVTSEEEFAPVAGVQGLPPGPSHCRGARHRHHPSEWHRAGRPHNARRSRGVR